MHTPVLTLHTPAPMAAWQVCQRLLDAARAALARRRAARRAQLEFAALDDRMLRDLGLERREIGPRALHVRIERELFLGGRV